MMELQVAKVLRCDCPRTDHALLLLRDREGARGVKVRVGAEVGRAIVAHLAGLTTVGTEVVDLLGAALRALDVQAEAVTLACASDALHAQLRLRTAHGALDVGVDASQAMLTACRLQLPIFVGEPAGTRAAAHDVPSVYRPLLETLDLGSLDAPETTT